MMNSDPLQISGCIVKLSVLLNSISTTIRQLADCSLSTPLDSASARRVRLDQERYGEDTIHIAYRRDIIRRRPPYRSDAVRRGRTHHFRFPFSTVFCYNQCYGNKFEQSLRFATNREIAIVECAQTMFERHSMFQKKLVYIL